MVPADSRRIPRVPRYSGYRYAAFRFTYWTITVYGHIFQSVLFTICIQCRGPTTPLTPCDVNGLGYSPFARHYWGNHYYPTWLDNIYSRYWVVPFGNLWITHTAVVLDYHRLAFYAYIVPFLISTAVGAVIAGAVVFSLQRSGALRSMQSSLS